MSKNCLHCQKRDQEVTFLRSLVDRLVDQNALLRGIPAHFDNQHESPSPEAKGSKAFTRFFADVLGSEDEASDDQTELGLQST